MTPATACPRCGTFAALTDDGWRTLCGPCHATTRHPLAVPGHDPGLLIGSTFKLWRDTFWVALAIGLALGIPKVLLQWAIATPSWFDLAWSSVVGSYGEAMLLSLVAEKVLGGAYRVDRAVERSNRRYLGLVVINLVTNALSMLGLLACVVGMFLVGALTIQAIPIALFESANPRVAVASSYRRAKPAFISLAIATTVFTVPLVVLPIAHGLWTLAATQLLKDPSRAEAVASLSRVISTVVVLSLQLLTAGPQLLEFVVWLKLRPRPELPAAAAPVIATPVA